MGLWKIPQLTVSVHAKKSVYFQEKPITSNTYKAEQSIINIFKQHTAKSVIHMSKA